MRFFKRTYIFIIKNTVLYFILLFVVLPDIAQASFIETTMGTAVLNDATASYYNPAALVLMKNSQIIFQDSAANFYTQFTGQTTSTLTGTTNTGTSSSNTRYYSPSLYAGMPASDDLIIGLALVSNSATRSVDENSILRYIQANNTIEDYDLTPALAIKLSDNFSIGAGINFSYANFNLQPITGFPESNIADSQSTNKSSGSGIGGNIGFLFKPNSETLIGMNYRSMTTYHQSGQSTFSGPPQVISNQYHYILSTPARFTLSINHFFNKKIGLIGTIQRIQWSTLTNIHVYGIANSSGGMPVILNGVIPYYLRNTWLFTLGTHYRMTPKWILRAAGSYNQSPGNPYYQIANGDSVILGVSIGYKLNKTMTIDGSYAHAFLLNENININGARFMVSGINKGSRDGISLKLTLNV